jgi:hypothetical protein
MLGEISLDEWRCIAELIDNPIDAFLGAARSGTPIDHPEVRIGLPMTMAPGARITIRDNGPGMDVATLELAARAGWTSHDPINHLGLFGMGFNIATARLGTVTTVWTTQAGQEEWSGLRIDFNELQAQGSFLTRELRRVKADRSEHGTEIVIEKLKPQYQEWFAKASNVLTLRKMLGRTYASMLRPHGVPLTFGLFVGGTPVKGHEHCVWGDPNGTRRTVQVSSVGTVDSYQEIDARLQPRPFCNRCWMWLSNDVSLCPQCERSDLIVQRDRHIRGWIGVQRYLSRTEYGLDFIRNGRKIEIGNTDLFVWSDGTSREPEYPIDDPRQRGRIVGEIHLDHCRVTYTKDAFDRHDPAWGDMLRVVRGEGPLRPDKAHQMNFGQNTSPLFRLYQAFRRSTPKPKVAGCWAKLLVVPDNDAAEEMARRFDRGEVEYRSDLKWWALVQEADRQLLVQVPGGGQPGGAPGGPLIPGFGEAAPPPVPSPPSLPGSPQPAPTVPPSRTPIASLTREYVEPATRQRWKIEAFLCSPADPQLSGGKPWSIRALPNGVTQFFVDSSHAVFRSMTLTPLDALLAELSWSAMDFQRGVANLIPFSIVLSNLRDTYGGPSKLDPASLSAEAASTLIGICRKIAAGLDVADAAALFDELSAPEKEAIYSRMAVRAVRNPQEVIATGRFLEFAQKRTLLAFFERHPELFFDGKCFDAAYGSLEYGAGAATDEARRQVVRYYGSLLADAVWIADQESASLDDIQRERLLRCLLAVDLLSEAVAVEPAIQ